MTTTTKIARVSFAALAIFVGIEPVHAQWTGGPVLIGGDDTDDHFVEEGEGGEPLGKPYVREGFNFVGAHVTNGNTIAAYIGCNPAKREQK